MSFTMKINMKEVEDWVKNQAHRDMARKQAMTTLGNVLRDEVNKAITPHNVSGDAGLSGSINMVATDKKVTIWSASYGDIVLEYGRRPGGYPPLEPLREWVAKRMGVPVSQNYMLAKTIQRNIHDRGTQKYRTGTDAAGTGRQLTEIEERMNRDIMPSRMEYLLNEYTK